MGFMDKAKKMAEQAQAKLDEAQKQFNSGQEAGGGEGGGAVEYDTHGRPVQPAGVTPDAAGAPPVATPGVPPTDTPSAPARTGPTPDPGAPATPGAPPGFPPPATPPPPAGPGPPPAPGAPAPPGAPPSAPAAATPPAATGPTPDPGAPEDRNHPSTEAPKVTHGDPLAG